MTRIPVDSSNLASVGYDGRTLEVEFLNGSVYQYSGVPDEVYEALMSADSHGKYFNANIRTSYSYRKVR
ncbi:KTSC domain-containing protein [Fibrella sp. WM1]|uniref:KTSC domain-containing protein n=1 Tax=Fibrella musci TaxID=3242485 RepID=UPI00352007B8